ncbi:TonB-dependent receptor [Aquimarina sp. D1M17]|uniref:SusC/RagA family TonB-linked outer membrane protein n=1 Tax=Aquimarina acroporae TaxID=2937283 RepID=UPI0020C06E23|nr:TonB-dependent receptor [Aquimarina acroporae]MCK8523406.1 TonB-dependent receptor [Aquimarina acroporae]
MNFKIKLIFTVLVLLQIPLLAQDSYLLSGKVTDDKGLPIPGVNVIISNTTKGASTDFDGLFQIEVKNDDVLQISYIGYVAQTIVVSGQKNVEVVLVEDSAVLDEVVVIGYGTQKKSLLTGSISKVVNEDLDQIAVSRVDEALIGQVSGVNIRNSEGEAGSAPTIRIRGVGSITSNNGPLVVVDGAVVDSDFLTNLDMNNVESFEVLKDAASAAIFGSRGSNGVIQITTKEGKEGKAKFTYNTFTGIKEGRRSDDYDIDFQAELARERQITGGLSLGSQFRQFINAENDWQDIVLDGGTIQSHSFSVRGGNKKTKYNVNLSYVSDEGVLLTDSFERYQAQLKLSTKVTDNLKIGASFSPSYSKRRRFSATGLYDVVRQPSWVPTRLNEFNINLVNRVRDGGRYADAQIGDYVLQRMFDDYQYPAGATSIFDASGNFQGVPVTSGVDISNTSNINPLAKLLERRRFENRYNFYGNLYADYKFTDYLSFKSTFTATYENRINTDYQGINSSRNGAAAASASYDTRSRYALISDNIISFNKIFGKHKISAIAGVSLENRFFEESQIEASGFTSDLIPNVGGGSIINDATAFEYENFLNGFLGRVIYSYDDKYLFNASIRRDGSSVFGSDTKYGNFPAVSAGWVVSNEKFMENADWVNQLKFRVSYGVTGTNALNGDFLTENYPSLALLEPSSAVVDGAITNGFDPVNIPNALLQWERSEEINPGVDFGFFNNAISGSVDYYKRTSDELLLDNPVSGTTGFTSALVNLGTVENEGFEVELRTRIISTPKVKWEATVIGSYNKNTLVDFGDSNGQVVNTNDGSRLVEWINLVGQPISSFYGYVFDRDIPFEFLNDPFRQVGNRTQFAYAKDLNGDGLIDEDDKTILGDPYPDLIWSFGNNVTIGNMDFSFLFQGSHGAKTYNLGDQYIFDFFNSNTVDFDRSITPDQEFLVQRIFTSQLVQNAGYVALRTVTLGYNFPKEVTSNLNLSNLRLYATGQNLLFITADDYTGWNPEHVRELTPLTFGYQRGGTPIQRTITLGVNVEF